MSLHEPFPDSITLFAPCSMERLYQHERKDFEVRPRGSGRVLGYI